MSDCVAPLVQLFQCRPPLGIAWVVSVHHRPEHQIEAIAAQQLTAGPIYRHQTLPAYPPNAQHPEEFSGSQGRRFVHNDIGREEAINAWIDPHPLLDGDGGAQNLKIPAKLAQIPGEHSSAMHAGGHGGLVCAHNYENAFARSGVSWHACGGFLPPTQRVWLPAFPSSKSRGQQSEMLP